MPRRAMTCLRGIPRLDLQEVQQKTAVLSLAAWLVHCSNSGRERGSVFTSDARWYAYHRPAESDEPEGERRDRGGVGGVAQSLWFQRARCILCVRGGRWVKEVVVGVEGSRRIGREKEGGVDDVSGWVQIWGSIGPRGFLV